MAKSKLPSPGTGGGSITKGLMSIGKGLAKTAGKIYRGLVGPEQAQTYGWTEQFFPSKPKKEKENKVKDISTTPANLGPTPGMGMDTEEILNLMKENYADEKRYREVQRSFAEEREGEEEKRHKELVTALKKFTGTKTTATPVAAKEEGGGFLDTIMNMFKALEEKVKGLIEKTVNGILEGIDLLKKADLMGKLMMFLRSPIFGLLSGPLLMVAGILGLAYLLRKAVELVPDYSKLTPEEAKNVLENGSEKDIKALGGREKLMEIAVGGKEEAQRILDTQAELTPEERARYEKIAGVTVTPQTPTELAPVVPKDLYVKNSRKTKAAAADWWDKNFGDTHNPDGTPKVKQTAKPLPQGVEPATDQSRADAAATDPRRVDLPQGAAFGVRPMGIKAAPVPPPPSPVAQLTDMNRDLEMYTSPMGDVGGPIVQQSNTQSAQNEPPIPSTATQRDEEPMSSHVFKNQRARARAY